MPSVQLYTLLIFYRLKWAPKVDYPAHKLNTCYKEKGEGKTKKKPLSSFLSLHLFCIPLCTFTPSSHHAYISPSPPHPPLLSCCFTLVVLSSNPCHQENRKSERKKFPNKSLWHREHLLGYCVYSSFCVRSKSHWRLQYVSSLWTSLIVCETSLRDKWSTLPRENRRELLERLNHNIQS